MALSNAEGLLYLKRKETETMKRFYTLFLICLTLNCWFSVANAQTVRMPDANLALVVRDALGLAPNAPITRQAMQGLTFLNAQAYKIREITGRYDRIKDLTGLEHATQLTRLWLNNNQISNIRPLATLSQLTELLFYNNQVRDINPITELTQLESLGIAHNPINNLRPLAELTQLRDLNISVGRISDIQPHVDLTQLESLEIWGDWESRTPISDLHLLGNLTQLTSLDVQDAQVSDLSFLRGLTQLEGLNLGSNQISDLKPLAGLTQLRWLYLGSNQISDLKPLARLTQLTDLGLSNNQIRDVSPLAGLTNLNSLYLRNNPIRDASPLANLPNLGYVDIPIPPQISIRNEIPDELPKVGKNLRYRVQIRNAKNVTGFKLTYETPHKLTAVKSVEYFDGVEHNPRTNPRSGTLTASRLETGQDIHNVAIFTLNATAAGKGDLRVLGQLTTTQSQFKVDIRYPITIFPSDEPQPSDNAGVIPDPNLAAAVRKALGLKANASITKQVMKKLTTLDVEGNQIKNLTGLEHATQLTFIALSYNQIRDVNPLTGLTQLREMTLDRNQIRDITPIASLKNLRGLGLGYNTPKISDITPLAGLTKLAWLRLTGNQIRDVSPLAELTNLETLWIKENPIQDTSPLASLPKLKNVDIDIPKSLVVHIKSPQRPPLYWVNTSTGTLHRLTGDEVEDLLPNVKKVTSFTVDVADGKIYWTNQTVKNNGLVKRANLDGSNAKVLAALQSVPTSIAIDTAKKKLYWTNSLGRIQHANLNGKQIRDLIKNLENPSNITLDPAGGKLYWTEASGRIRRANLNGKSVQNIASGLDPISDLTIAGNKIYWIEKTGESTGKIGRANLNGSNFTTLIRLQQAPTSLAIDPVGSKLYWSDSGGNIKRANLNGKNIQNVVSGLGAPANIVLGSAPAATAAAPARVREIPTQTALLANYPNPFNPETWIPYQLAEPSDVKITIYNTHGVVVRQLELGHQPAGTYTSQSRAAYWNGRNSQGERVASGIYFYQLQTDNVSSLRKMLILK